MVEWYFNEIILTCCCCWCRTALSLLIWYDVVVGDNCVIAIPVAIDTIRNNKSSVSILIEFPWWSAIVGLLLLIIMKYSLAV